MERKTDLAFELTLRTAGREHTVRREQELRVKGLNKLADGYSRMIAAMDNANAW